MLVSQPAPEPPTAQQPDDVIADQSEDDGGGSSTPLKRSGTFTSVPAAVENEEAGEQTATEARQLPDAASGFGQINDVI